MLIGICGAKCAGKSTVAQYLIDHHGFKKLHLNDESIPAQNGGASAQSTTATGDSPPAGINGKHLTSLQTTKLSRRGAPEHSFASVTALLDHVTRHWRSRWVTTDIHNEAVLDALSRRPFFILLSVDAPVTVRWQRHQQRQREQQGSAYHSSSRSSQSSSPTRKPGGGGTTLTTTGNDDDDDDDTQAPSSLETFVSESDANLYDPHTGVLALMSRAAVRLLNTSSDLAHLYATLGKLDLTNPDRLRPSWDSYFMQLASLAAQRCNCMKRAVGCVLVDGVKRTVISTGYNGTPRHLRNCGDGGCPRCNSGDSASGVALGTCLCLHAEENALLEAGRERIRQGSVLYCNTCPCLTCSIKIVQVGIGEVVYNQGYSMDTETAEVFRSAGVRLRQFSPPANGLIHLEKMELY
ncbi:cytidine deaminase-like protein [Microdochium bolleyi]|uniref:Deoxycytidylate deaminase n=1 Tax=Microdochium bolleyi TaxID=196109 RepID=A0A136J1G5_9PEZI|nr:cytidine deaminase-like protein [Microdochium bolleyi]